ncbi:unnamed protein product, partial [Ectocarpus fasciculatus]
MVPLGVSGNERRGGGCRPPGGAEAEQAMRPSRGQTTQHACQPEANDVARRRRAMIPGGREERTALEARDQPPRRFRPDAAAGGSDDTAGATARRRPAAAIARHSLRNAFLVLFAAILAAPRIDINPSRSTARLRGG